MKTKIEWFIEDSQKTVPGFYLLKNGTFSEKTVWEQEIGVMVDSNFYISVNPNQGSAPLAYQSFVMACERNSLNVALQKVGFPTRINLKGLWKNQRLKDDIFVNQIYKDDCPTLIFSTPNFVWFDNNEVFIRHDKMILRDIAKPFAATENAKYYTVGKYLLQKIGEIINIIGMEPQRFGEDILITIIEDIEIRSYGRAMDWWQITNEGVICFASHDHSPEKIGENLYTEDYANQYWGSEQWENTTDKYTYQKVDGLWKEIDHIHIDHSR